MVHLPGVDHVREDAVEIAFAQRPTAVLPALLRRPPLRGPAAAVHLARDGDQRPVFQVQVENRPDLRRLQAVHDQPPTPRINIVAEDRVAAGPLALASGGGDLVPSALADDLALELGEGQQDVQRQAPHGRSRIEGLRHGDEARAYRSNIAIIRAKSRSDRLSRSTL